MFRTLCNFFQRYRKLELLIIGIFLLSITLVLLGLHHFCEEKFNEIVFSFASCVGAVGILSFLGIYLVVPHFFRNLMALIGRKKFEDIVGPVISNNDDKEKPWEQKRDLAIPESTQELQIKEEKNKKNSKLEEIVNAFKQQKYTLVISAKDEILTENCNKKDEGFYRFLLEISYNEIEEYNLEDRIENLLLLCQNFKQNFPLSLFVSFQCNLAQLYTRQNQIEKATDLLVDIFTRINTKEYKLSHDGYARINDLQSTILLKQHRPTLALSYLKRAWEYSTEAAWYEFKIARIYYNKLNNPEKALEYAKNSFSHLKEDDGDDLYGALVNMCFFLEAFLGNYQSAYDSIDRSSIQDAHVMACKAYIATKLGKYDEAFQLARQVIEHDPTEITAFNAKGIIHLHRKEYTQAERCFSAVLPGFEKDCDMYSRYYTAEVYYHRGICNIQLNNLQQATADFQKAEELGYTDFEAKYLDTVRQYILKTHETQSTK